jgi:hypothetical protein
MTGLKYQVAVPQLVPAAHVPASGWHMTAHVPPVTQI